MLVSANRFRSAFNLGVKPDDSKCRIFDDVYIIGACQISQKMLIFITRFVPNSNEHQQ